MGGQQARRGGQQARLRALAAAHLGELRKPPQAATLRVRAQFPPCSRSGGTWSPTRVVCASCAACGAAMATAEDTRLALLAQMAGMPLGPLLEKRAGPTGTALLATVSPDAADLAESTRTLEFVQRAKIIVNRPKVNVDDTPIEVALGASDVMAGGFEAELAVLRRSVSQRGSTPILPPLPLSSFVRGRERMRASSIGAGAPKRPSTAPKWQRPSWRSRATSPRLPCGSQSKRHARSAALAPSASPPW